MKIRYLIGIIAIFLLMTLTGCNDAGEVIEGNVTEEVDGTNTTENEETEEIDVKALIKQLSEDAGLETEENESSDDVETTTTGSTIIIENFSGNPENVVINAGDTVTWTNMMTFNNIIIILPQKEDSNKFETVWMNKDLVQLWVEESYSYTFEEAGTYKWGSKTKFDKINGIITVKE